MKKTEQLKVRLSKDQIERLKLSSKISGVSMSDIIRDGIETYWMIHENALKLAKETPVDLGEDYKEYLSEFRENLLKYEKEIQSLSY